VCAANPQGKRFEQSGFDFHRRIRGSDGILEHRSFPKTHRSESSVRKCLTIADFLQRVPTHMELSNPSSSAAVLPWEA